MLLDVCCDKGKKILITVVDKSMCSGIYCAVLTITTARNAVYIVIYVSVCDDD